MAEITIATNAGLFTSDIKTSGPWICRDDNGHYWTVFRNTSDNVEIYHSENSGATWTLKKTLTTSDFTGLTFPVDDFNIANLRGENKVYILLNKRVIYKAWGWLINTSTDTGAKDLDGVSLTVEQARTEIRWDNYNKKLYIGAGRTTGNQGRYWPVQLNGTLGSVVDVGLSGAGIPYGFDIDSAGNKFFGIIAIISAIYYNQIVKNTGTPAIQLSAYTSSPTWSGLVVGWDDKPVFGFIIGTVIHLYKANNILTTLEINDSTYDLGSGHAPSTAFFTVDGNNNIYCVYTDSNDSEAYYIKYNVTTASWGSPTKLSSDNDGILICPELKSPLSFTSLLLSYQAVS